MMREKPMAGPENAQKAAGVAQGAFAIKCPLCIGTILA
jgi:hypothetical protein